MSSAFKRLTVKEARRALYIDFEGGRDKPPVLLGVLRRRGKAGEPKVFQIVVDPEFAPAGPEARPLREAIETVVKRAEKSDRRIVGWTEHDLDVVRTLGDVDADLVARFEARYANGRAVAERWMNKLHSGERPASGELVAYLALIEYQIPPDAGPGHVGDTIRALRPTLQGGRPLTANQDARWQRLLRHNRHDCAGMRAVCVRAANEMEAG